MPFYGVYFGPKHGDNKVFASWDECKTHVYGRKSKYKKFATADEARHFSQYGVIKDVADDLNKEEITCFCDGGEQKGRSGSGVVILNATNKQVEISASGRAPHTNNRAELTAVILALTHEVVQCSLKNIVIHTDSMYTINCMTAWMPKWRHNGFRSNSGPVKNQDLLKELDNIIQTLKPRTVRFQHVRGHHGNKYNELVDALATKALVAQFRPEHEQETCAENHE